ncbi:aminopeptidase N [Streptacidiphilus sp. MAP12-16]|uniref:M1 family metallopeptidase n=1 Tax=Streptacidiphilus sp. MAP12-16 TaxID=3156300 RepID=UPI00351520B7
MRYRTRVTAPVAALLTMAASLAAGPAARAADRLAPARGRVRGRTGTGAPGGGSVGDRVFPELGNSGYQVEAYHLDLTWRADTRLVDATATLSAYATQALSGFSLDALGLDIHGVRVNGRSAGYQQRGEKLLVIPHSCLPDRGGFAVEVDYTADPRRILPHTGWVPTPDGFATAGQPQSAHTVFPCNDHPSHKAAFDFRITVPEGLFAVANGSLVATTRTSTMTGAPQTTYLYRSRHPMATELVQISVGDYTVRTRQGPGGLPLRDIVPTSRAAALEPALALTPGMLGWLEQRLGPFPFETYGLLPCNSDDPDAFQFTGLETQTLTLYKPGFLLDPESSIGSHMMHELTHSWFGNCVSPASWSDLWLNEGHADYYGLLYRYEKGWTDSLGLNTLDDRMKYTYARGDQWRQDSGPVAAPSAANLWDSQRYTGGVLVLYALRQTVGEDTFNRIERTFLERYRHSVATTADYVAVASEVSGRDQSGFLNDWLYGTRTPKMPGHPDWTVTPATRPAPGSGTGAQRLRHDASATL